MSDVLLIVILLVSTATSTLTIRVLRSSRRSERFGEDHHELLLNQQDQLRLLREGQEHQRLIEELEKERKERLATQQQLERLEQQLLPLEQERQRLEEELSKLEQLPGKHQAELLGTYRSWRRRLIGVVLLLLGTAVLWLISLGVALYLLNA